VQVGQSKGIGRGDAGDRRVGWFDAWAFCRERCSGSRVQDCEWESGEWEWRRWAATAGGLVGRRLGLALGLYEHVHVHAHVHVLVYGYLRRGLLSATAMQIDCFVCETHGVWMRMLLRQDTRSLDAKWHGRRVVVGTCGILTMSRWYKAKQKQAARWGISGRESSMQRAVPQRKPASTSILLFLDKHSALWGVLSSAVRGSCHLLCVLY
jgi:hypothetical protein